MPLTRYAEHTSVKAEKSRNDIEKTLVRYGASQFLYGWDDKESVSTVMFVMNNRRIKFMLPMPSKDQFKTTPGGRRRRNQSQVINAWEQSTRQRWRALGLVIKAKLEAVESGITEFEAEFMAHIMLPDGKTVGEFMIPQIDSVYKTGKMPALLPDLRSK